MDVVVIDNTDNILHNYYTNYLRARKQNIGFCKIIRIVLRIVINPKKRFSFHQT